MPIGDSTRVQTMLDRLARSAAGNADAHAMADAAVESWDALLQQLAPLIGDKGVRALYSRSVHLGAATYPWLAGLPKSAPPAPVLAELRSALDARPAAEVQATCAALITTFTNVLATLIGETLTDRLLASAWPEVPGPTSTKAFDD